MIHGQTANLYANVRAPLLVGALTLQIMYKSYSHIVIYTYTNNTFFQSE